MEEYFRALPIESFGFLFALTVLKYSYLERKGVKGLEAVKLQLCQY